MHENAIRSAGAIYKGAASFISSISAGAPHITLGSLGQINIHSAGIELQKNEHEMFSYFKQRDSRLTQQEN